MHILILTNIIRDINTFLINEMNDIKYEHYSNLIVEGYNYNSNSVEQWFIVHNRSNSIDQQNALHIK